MTTPSSTATCQECAALLPKGHRTKFCNTTCLQANLDKYWHQPLSKPKRWYTPVPKQPITRTYRQPLLAEVEADMRQLEQLLLTDNIDLELY